MAKNLEESSPLLKTNSAHDEESKQEANDSSSLPTPLSKQPPLPPIAQPQVAETCGWTVDGLPMSVVGQPMIGRAEWSSGLCSCLGRNDEFCSSDLEVCLLGSVCPCVLYGSNVERLGSAPGSFSTHCMTYTALYLIGNSFFGWNCLAPSFSYTSRTAVRRRFNLEGSCEGLTRNCGSCGSFVGDEQCEIACDFATHVFCHLCSLCQEAREIRRRLPHPGFNPQPVMLMMPPSEQAMGR